MGDGDETAISAEEYATWLRPGEALERLPDNWGKGHSERALLTHLALADIRAAARSRRAGHDPNAPPARFVLIPAELWSDRHWQMGSEALWVTGNVSFHQGSRLAEVLGRASKGPDWIEHIFTGVRFDPIGFAESVGDPHPASEALPSSKPLSPAEMTRFINLYLEIWTADAREMPAFAAVQACYPNYSISRDPFLAKFREIRGPGKRGKPPNRGK